MCRIFPTTMCILKVQKYWKYRNPLKCPSEPFWAILGIYPCNYTYDEFSWLIRKMLYKRKNFRLILSTANGMLQFSYEQSHFYGEHYTQVFARKVLKPNWCSLKRTSFAIKYQNEILWGNFGGKWRINRTLVYYNSNIYLSVIIPNNFNTLPC